MEADSKADKATMPVPVGTGCGRCDSAWLAEAVTALLVLCRVRGVRLVWWLFSGRCSLGPCCAVQCRALTAMRGSAVSAAKASGRGWKGRGRLKVGE